MNAKGVKMIEIDGSKGEGGGSILRFSLALAAVKEEPIEIHNIRAKRSKPGLGNQHLAAVRALQKLTEAEVKGAEVGSKRITFRPKKIKEGKVKVDIGTAGSTTLILQATMLPATFAEGPVKIEIIGGTDNPFAPPIDYMKNVTLPMLKRIGYSGEVEIIKRGHYPKGGGKIRAEIRPVEELEPLKIPERGEIASISGRSHCVRLPGHIAERQAKSAEKRLREAGYSSDIEVESYKKSEDPHPSPGSGIVLWAKTQNGAILGSSALGKKGKPAEKVGKEAAGELIEQLETGKAVDRYLADQLIPYLALTPDESEITAAELTSHATTNADLVRMILGTDIEVEGEIGGPGRILIEGI